MEGRKVWEGKRVSGEERAGGPEDRAMEEEDGGRRGEEPAEREGG